MRLTYAKQEIYLSRVQYLLVSCSYWADEIQALASGMLRNLILYHGVFCVATCKDVGNINCEASCFMQVGFKTCDANDDKIEI